jgi:hypothetical protein
MLCSLGGALEGVSVGLIVVIVMAGEATGLGDESCEKFKTCDILKSAVYVTPVEELSNMNEKLPFGHSQSLKQQIEGIMNVIMSSTASEPK